MVKVGDRIELVRMEDDPDPVPTGTRGKVTGVSKHAGWMQVWVTWDNGRRLALTVPPDEFDIVRT